MPIRKLPPLLVNQIAAGEVIERPASVVKELVENSLDAGASRIDVQIEEGGTKLIRVSDDGAGIAPDELELAIAPHATSKITSPDDLAAIRTLGFRGEALASIASVSRLRVTSRPTVNGEVAEAASMIEAAGDDVSSVTPAAGAPGTVMEVRDLFFNTPARRRFLRAASTEFGHINELVTRLAMAHPHVAFKLTHNGRVVTDVIATDDRRTRCVELLGKALDEALLEFESEEMCDVRCAMSDVSSPDAASPSDIAHRTSNIEHPQIWGLAGLPAIARATAKFQYVCLNGRFIRDKRVSHAIKEAYRGLMPPDRQPVAVVFITIDPALVDVNVHPAKSEVRFRDANRIHGIVLNTLRQRLLGSDLTPSARLTMTSGLLRDDDESAGDSAPQATTTHPAFGAPAFDRGAATFGSGGHAYSSSGAGSAMATGASAGPSGLGTAQSFVDYFKRMAPQQKGFVYRQVREAMREESGLLDEAGALDNDADTAAIGSQTPVRSEPILQVHKSYVVTQDEEGILIVDQHALHERVMFEELKRRVLDRSLESQRLLMPAVIDADAGRLGALEQANTLLDRIGVEAEPIGPRSIAVHAFPTFLFDRKVDPVDFLGDLLDRVAQGEIDVTHANALESALHEVLDMMACKAAIKAGDAMSPQELAALLARRADIERASNCPHGRPTTLRLSIRELEKQFGRT